MEKKFGYKINCVFIEEEEYKTKRKKKDAALKKILSGKRISLIGRV